MHSSPCGQDGALLLVSALPGPGRPRSTDFPGAYTEVCWGSRAQGNSAKRDSCMSWVFFLIGP